MKEQFFDLMAGEDNPRNSEGSFIRLKNGDILFVYTKYTGTSCDDYATADLAAWISPDGGRTWQDRGVIISRGDADNVMSVSLLRLQNGRILLSYLEKRNARRQCIPVYRFSDDVL